MAYADVEDVRRNLGRYSAQLSDAETDPDKHPNTEDVIEFVEDHSAEVDAILSSLGYQTPVIDAPEFARTLRLLVAYGAAADTVAAMLPGTTGAAATEYHKWLSDRYEIRLASLRKGEGIPADLIVVTGGTDAQPLAPRSLWTSHPLGYDSTRDEHYGPVFKRGEDQW